MENGASEPYIVTEIAYFSRFFLGKSKDQGYQMVISWFIHVYRRHPIILEGFKTFF